MNDTTIPTDAVASYDEWLDMLNRAAARADAARAEAERAKAEKARLTDANEGADLRAALITLGFDPGELRSNHWTTPGGIRFMLTREYHAAWGWTSAKPTPRLFELNLSMSADETEEGREDGIYIRRSFGHPSGRMDDADIENIRAALPGAMAEMRSELNQKLAARAAKTAAAKAAPTLPDLNRLFFATAHELRRLAEKVLSGGDLNESDVSILAHTSMVISLNAVCISLDAE
jgi:hypothetical protein